MHYGTLALKPKFSIVPHKHKSRLRWHLLDVQLLFSKTTWDRRMSTSGVAWCTPDTFRDFWCPNRGVLCAGKG